MNASFGISLLFPLASEYRLHIYLAILTSASPWSICWLGKYWSTFAWPQKIIESFSSHVFLVEIWRGALPGQSTSFFLATRTRIYLQKGPCTSALVLVAPWPRGDICVLGSWVASSLFIFWNFLLLYSWNWSWAMAANDSQPNSVVLRKPMYFVKQEALKSSVGSSLSGREIRPTGFW